MCTSCTLFSISSWRTKKSRSVRPINIKSALHQAKTGVGTRVVRVKGKRVRITNVLGLSSSAKNVQTNPFLFMDKFLKEIKGKQDIHIVDFHTNATSEKNAFFVAYKSKVSAIVGTHTHVQTADEIIKDNTAYITDVGMTGPAHGIIGADPTTILQMFREQVLHFKLDPDKSKYQFCAVLLTFNDKTNKPTAIEIIYIRQK